jgi:hypothetical protein
VNDQAWHWAMGMRDGEDRAAFRVYNLPRIAHFAA